MLRHRGVIGLLVAALLWTVAPIPALGSAGFPSSEEPRRVAAQLPATEDPIAAYRGLGTWVDMYDAPPWRYPRRSVRKMSEKGVRTLYLETANYRKPKNRRLYRPAAMAAMVDAAHEHGIKVVAWYVPGFKNLRRDFRRTMAALDFQTDAGHRFDSFALDIEATLVSDIETRNRKARRLSRRIRDAVGADYPLGAIVPEAGALYWPDFPYRGLANFYDVFLPMAYYSYRTSGASGVYSFISNNVEVVRSETGDANVPVHVIGGIAEDSTPREVAAHVRGAVDTNAIGTSLYDFPTTTPRQWRKLAEVP